MTVDSEVQADVFIDAVRERPQDRLVLRLTIDDLSTTCEGATARAIIALLAGDASAPELPAELTTGQVADVLGVSRPTVVGLIDSGELPATRIGSHRRVRAVDALDFRERRRAERRAALDELTRLSQEAGLYD